MGGFRWRPNRSAAVSFWRGVGQERAMRASSSCGYLSDDGPVALQLGLPICGSAVFGHAADRARSAYKELITELCFKLFDLMADRGLRDSQQVGAGAKASSFHDRYENFQSTECRSQHGRYPTLYV